MDINFVVNISARAWGLPILWHMHSGVAGRQAPLLAATGANRAAFAQSVAHLMSLGVLERNPGYGHPLRPEFRLTDLGRAAAEMAKDIHAAAEPTDHDLLRRSWTVPVLTTLNRTQHFGDIKRRLPMITDRALSQSLRSLEDRQWVLRDVDTAARPPRPFYVPANAGARISQATAHVII